MKHEIVAILAGGVVGSIISYVIGMIVGMKLKSYKRKNEKTEPKCHIEENQTDLEKEVFNQIKHLLKTESDSFKVEILTESFLGNFRNLTNRNKNIGLNTNGYIYSPLKIILSKDQKKEIKDLCDPIKDIEWYKEREITLERKLADKGMEIEKLKQSLSMMTFSIVKE